MISLVGKKVKIRWKRYFSEQRVWVFIGEVLEMDENWIMVKGRGYLLDKFSLSPILNVFLAKTKYLLNILIQKLLT